MIAVLSLYRPGPMDSIPTYIDCRHHPSHIRYKHERLRGILDVTYGCIVYQEQVMQIFRELAGYSLGRADIVRRAMSKKKHDVMERERAIFIHGMTDENGNVVVEGCVRRGIDEAAAASVFSEMESFASYAFNKSHAAAYAAVSYKTAWLKCYMAALLSSVLDSQNKLASYTAECRRLGIDVLPPNVNESYLTFSVSGGNIRYGLLAIKNLGKAFIEEIIRERTRGVYRSFYDFCKRLYGRNMNSRAVDSLIRCGAFDGMGANRRQLLAIQKPVLDDLEYTSRHKLDGQLSFFDLGGDNTLLRSVEPVLPALEEFSRDELLHMENETAGMYFSGHPMDDYTLFAERVRADRIGAILFNDSGAYTDGKKVCVVGVVMRVKTQLTKNNKTMAFITIEDRYGSIEAVVFPNVYERFGFYLGETSVVILRGSLNLRENEDPKILCDSVEQARTNEECKNHPPTTSQKPAFKPSLPQALYLRIDDLNTPLYEKARRVLDIFDGNTPVIFYLTRSNRKVKAPSSLWVSLNDVMLRELKYQLGEKNVAVR